MPWFMPRSTEKSSAPTRLSSLQTTRDRLIYLCNLASFFKPGGRSGGLLLRQHQHGKLYATANSRTAMEAEIRHSVRYFARLN